MKQIFKIFSIILMLAVVFALTACQDDSRAPKVGKETTEKAGDKIEGTGGAVVKDAEKTGGYLDDTAITAKVKADILLDPKLKVFEIDVFTTDGVVKLNGMVDSKLSIDKATEIARSVKDVKSVQNNLVIKE